MFANRRRMLINAVSGSNKCGTNCYYSYENGVLRIFPKEVGQPAILENIADFSELTLTDVYIEEGITKWASSCSLNNLSCTNFYYYGNVGTTTATGFGYWNTFRFENLYLNTASLVSWFNAGKHIDWSPIFKSATKNTNKLYYNGTECRILTSQMLAGATGTAYKAFLYCSSLQTVEIPSTAFQSNAIYAYSFESCVNLTTVTIASGAKAISFGCFANCKNLNSISLPSTILEIGSKAFLNCTSITSITFEGTPTSIVSDSFSGCTNLTDIYVPWSEGEVANAPWGASNATIHYDTV